MINNLPEKLKLLRLNNHLTQKAVADRLEISPSIVSGYEIGDRTPSIEVLLSLSYLYKCSTDYLLGKENTPPPVALDITGLNDKQISALQALIETMKA
ncbi:helix-turn-helix domain-containing protein [Eisenbergiella tayi]|uniref:helix-turn-helix domain-containing protein n=1 Tax=Eisenbergiella tayi TaxID=1432052 RepID=UPI0008484CB7|nr:helix-turn-helix transcriptional regulator [Eisenbergiella tayi]ODR33645.1 hypothetical protein BEI60_23790 [Eisenbergiella tayi]